MGLERQPIRSRAFAVLGAREMLAAHPGHRVSVQILEACGEHMRGMLRLNRRDGWYWFEDHLSYDNARLPEALIRAGIASSNDGMIADGLAALRSEEHTSELQSLMRISYDVFCLPKK